MKNLYLLPTDKTSRLHKIGNEWGLTNNPNFNPFAKQQNICITSDEEIQKGDWVLYTKGIKIHYIKITNDGDIELANINDSGVLKIILTTDQDLINDGVQAIDDSFLEWFVMNPSCEYVTVYEGVFGENRIWKKYIIIPKEEPKPIHQQIIDTVGGEDRFREIAGLKHKQETLEEAAERLYPINIIIDYDTNEDIRNIWIEGAKWYQEHGQEVGHSVQVDVIDLIQFLSMDKDFNGYGSVYKETANYFLEKYKKSKE